MLLLASFLATENDIINIFHHYYTYTCRQPQTVHFQLSYCCCKKVYFVQRGEGKGFFLKKLSCSSGFTRRREQIRPESPLSNQGFNLFQSPQISTPCQLEHRLSYSIRKIQLWSNNNNLISLILYFSTTRFYISIVSLPF